MVVFVLNPFIHLFIYLFILPKEKSICNSCSKYLLLNQSILAEREVISIRIILFDYNNFSHSIIFFICGFFSDLEFFHFSSYVSNFLSFF